MKKFVLTAVAAVAAFAGANAQTSATNVQNVVVPSVLSVVTSPSPANQTTVLTDAMLATTNNLPDVAYTVRSNAPWSFNATWAFSATNNDAASIANFQNAYQVQVPALGVSWLTLAGNPGAGSVTNQAVTAYAGNTFTMNHRVGALNFSVLPGTYTATITATVTQP